MQDIGIALLSVASPSFALQNNNYNYIANSQWKQWCLIVGKDD